MSSPQKTNTKSFLRGSYCKYNSTVISQPAVIPLLEILAKNVIIFCQRRGACIYNANVVTLRLPIYFVLWHIIVRIECNAFPSQEMACKKLWFWIIKTRKTKEYITNETIFIVKFQRVKVGLQLLRLFKDQHIIGQTHSHRPVFPIEYSSRLWL